MLFLQALNGMADTANDYLYDKLVTQGASTFDSKGMKTARLGLTVGAVLIALVKQGLSLFGIL